MRIRVEIATRASELPWSRVLSPGRGIAYDLLADTAPHLASQLHEVGWGQHEMVPFGHGAPIFPEARRRPGVYAVGGKGFVEFGSPLLSVVDAWDQALRDRDLLDWGGTALRILTVRWIDPPDFTTGRATLRTATPVVLKTSCFGEDQPSTWLLPAEPGYEGYLRQNLRHKAETLGVPAEVELEAVTWFGPRRLFTVSGGGKKPGAEVEVALSGAPETLSALWSWGLGESNSAGFGYIGGIR